MHNKYGKIHKLREVISKEKLIFCKVGQMQNFKETRVANDQIS